MKPGGQITAAINVLERIFQTGRPAEVVLRNWGRQNRIAGSRDRAAIGQYVFQVLRHRSRCAWRSGDDSPRGLIIGYLALSPKPFEEWSSWFDGSQHAPAPLSMQEKEAVEGGAISEPTLAQKFSVPEISVSEFTQAFGDDIESELDALLQRAPVDLIVNRSKVVRKAARAHLKRQDIECRAMPHSEDGLRIEVGSGVRPRQVTQSKAFQAGEVDIQDEGSQLIVQWCEASSDHLVVDLCAGGGGKTLGLAFAMKNRGQIFACDVNERRLDNMMPRLTRTGVRNVQMRQIVDWSPEGDQTDPNLEDLASKADLVLVDAPCSGSGSWRRHPDAKWRLNEEMLGTYTELQSKILNRAARLVRPGGRLVYATCSLFPRENDERVAAFLADAKDFAVDAIETEVPVRRSDFGLLLTPHRTGTDGFYVSRLKRND